MPASPHPPRVSSRDSLRLRIAIAVALVPAIGVADFLTDPEISLSIFYLIPVALAAWWNGAALAVALSVASAATWLVADHLAGRVSTGTFAYYWNIGSLAIFLLLVATLLAQLRRKLVHERRRSRLDPLTRLLNRRAFREIAQAEIARAERYRRPLALAYLDLDRFKEVNDTRGHAIGDGVLRTVAAAIAKSVRRTDVVARVGGDEFALLFPETTPEAARTAVAKVQTGVDQAMRRHGWPVTLSIGILTCRIAFPNVDEMMRTADELMYSVKDGSGDGIADMAYESRFHVDARRRYAG